MLDNSITLYGYNLNCKLIEKVSGCVIKCFKAREFKAKDISIQSFSGGLSGFSRDYAIATRELTNYSIEPKNHKIEVCGQLFSVIQVGVSNLGLPYQKDIQVEKVVSLE